MALIFKRTLLNTSKRPSTLLSAGDAFFGMKSDESGLAKCTASH
jgi:hypothetical protein